MVGAVAFTYGMLASFVLSGATRNLRLRRPHPPTMMYLGYLLIGVSLGLVVLGGAGAVGLIAIA